MTIDREDQLDGLKRIGLIVGRTLEAMRAAAEPGMTTAELDAIAAELLEQEGARSAPRLTYNFPGDTCISVFPAIAHGIPGDEVAYLNKSLTINGKPLVKNALPELAKLGYFE